jgi:oxygen-dependent protoporphyrinogen oxidase
MSAERRANARKVVAVVGGGVSGLAAAYELTRGAPAESPRPEVVLLEASARTGGTVRTEHRDGFLLEAGPDAFITDKPAALELAREIGLEPNLIPTNGEHRRAFVVRGGRTSLALRSPCGTVRRARTALDAAVGSGEPAAAASPMVGGIYTADPELLSLRATMPRFIEMERRHGSVIRALLKARRAENKGGNGASGARYGLFLSLDGGLQLLTDRLAEQLPPGVIRTNTRVESLSPDETSGRWSLVLNDGTTLAADAVCLALPAYASARLLGETDPALAAELEAIPYASTATVNLAFRRADIPHPLDGFGFVVPHAERRNLIACSFSSVKFANRAPAGCTLLRAFVGGALQPEMFHLDDDRMLRAVREDLRGLLGVTAPPLFAQINRWPRSMAQYTVGHLARMTRVRARLSEHPTLRLAGNAYTGAGLPDCVREGRTAAREISSTLAGDLSPEGA